MFDRVLNMPQILNMPTFWIYQGSEYASGSEYAGDHTEKNMGTSVFCKIKKRCAKDT